MKFWGLIAADAADAAAVAVGNSGGSIVEVGIGFSLVAYLWVKEGREIAEVGDLVVGVGISV